jgi:prepilin-type N-terminal cleavage/methylation domain-containing protein
MEVKAGCRGFTLVEIMVLLAVMGFLLIIAMPDQAEPANYNKKALAKAFLLKVSAYQASYFQQHREYASSVTSLGLTASEDLKAQYNFQLKNVTEPSGLNGYSIKAMPINSVDSQVLWLNHLGQTSVNWND